MRSKIRWTIPGAGTAFTVLHFATDDGFNPEQADADAVVTKVNQYVTTIKANLPNVKQEEIDATGILDYLATQEGKVTKEQVQAFMEQGGVKVTETVLGQPSPQPAHDADGIRRLCAAGYGSLAARRRVCDVRASSGSRGHGT